MRQPTIRCRCVPFTAPWRAAITTSCGCLIEHGADLNVKQHGGWTPLHAAAMHGDEALVELFLKHGADRNLKSDDGQTAADLAASKGYTEIGKKLNV